MLVVRKDSIQLKFKFRVLKGLLFIVWIYFYVLFLLVFRYKESLIREIYIPSLKYYSISTLVMPMNRLVWYAMAVYAKDIWNI